MALFGCRLIESLGRDVLLVLEQSLGVDHPNSIITRENLAAVLQN